jgi:hypothetical protein
MRAGRFLRGGRQARHRARRRTGGADAVGRHGDVRGLLGLAAPDPRVGAVADHVGLAEVAHQRDAGLVGTGVPDPQRVLAGDQRGEVGAARAGQLGHVGQPEVGALRDRAGQAVEAGGLQVDQQLRGGTGCQ